MSEFGQLMVQGISTGSIYALIAVAFAVVYQTSRVLNFSQGGMLLMGTYLTAAMASTSGLPFVLAVLFSAVVVGLISVGYYVFAIRPTTGSHDFVPIMSSLGFGILIIAAVELVFGPDPRLLGDPWGADAVSFAGLTVLSAKVWSIALVAIVLVALLWMSRRSSYGVAIRALSLDEEAAASVGIPVARVHAIAWIAAGVLGTVAGVLLAAYPGSPNLTLGEAALRAFPAVVLGGLASVNGAIVGALIIGVCEAMTSGYAPDWAGANAHAVVPYLVMMVILLIRPDGLFGTAKVARA